MDITGINYDEFTRSFMELGEEKKKCGLLEAQVVAQAVEIERLNKLLELLS